MNSDVSRQRLSTRAGDDGERLRRRLAARRHRPGKRGVHRDRLHDHVRRADDDRADIAAAGDHRVRIGGHRWRHRARYVARSPRPVEISGAKAGFANGIEIRTMRRDAARPDRQRLRRERRRPRGTAGAGDRFGQQLITVEECFIGTDTTAAEARPNGMRGISVETPFTNAADIRNSTISGNRLQRRRGLGGAIGRRSVSTAASASAATATPLGNGASGVYIDGGAAGDRRRGRDCLQPRLRCRRRAACIAM